MKKILFLLSALIPFLANGQFTSYSKYDNVYNAVYEVEDMEPSEIKAYNKLILDSTEKEKELAIYMINAGRAQKNLLAAPATIVDYYLASSEITEADSKSCADGAVSIVIILINSTPKTIKEVTFTFELFNDREHVYDIKTGDKYCILTFNNLTGRTTSNIYVDIATNIRSCYHILSTDNAASQKPFYNKKANIVSLHSIKIRYTDGSVSTKAAIFNCGFKDKLLNDGPLSPVIQYLNNTSN